MGCLTSSTVVAGAAEYDDSSRVNSLRAGSWSLDFQISYDFQLTSFEGSALSIKRHHSSRTAFRLGVGFGLEYTEEDLVQQSTGADTTFTSQESDEDFDGRLDVTLEYLNYPNAGSKVSAYWGAGPLVRLIYDNKEHALGLGAVAVMGVEWFPARAVSLHAEYGLIAAYMWSQTGWGSTPEVRVVDGTRTTEMWAFGARPVLFGLSVYF